MNFDNESSHSNKDTRDWAVHFMFWGPGASEASARAILWDEGYRDEGNKMYLALLDARDGDGWGIHSDDDRGLKGRYSPSYCDGREYRTNRHMRFYADKSDQRMKNDLFNNYVLATVHYDRNEGTSCEDFGWSEDAENYFIFLLDTYHDVCIDCLELKNFEDVTYANGNKHQSDGWATMIRIP